MRSGNVRMALASLRRSRGRSLLTMFGIIIGVVAVMLTISIGAGVTRQMKDQLNQVGPEVITVRPTPTNKNGSYLADTGIFAGFGSTPLTQQDWSTVSQSNGVETAVPLGVGSGFATVDGKRLDGSTIIATSENFPKIINQPIQFGVFFNDQELNGNVAVIGTTVAQDLFQESAPIGRTLSIRGQDFMVRGVFQDFGGNPLSLGADLNRAVFIPYPVASNLANAPVPIAEVFAKANGPVQPAIASISQNLQTAHAGQADFSVLSRDQTLKTSSQTVTLITELVSGLAALSLLVGGIGIVNIMLVSVSERTREIGVRKAVGATNQQILSQFLIEAATLSAVGGLIGVVLALGSIFLIRITTDLHPIITLPVVILTPLAAWIVGVIFGVAPAISAARKDPIDALRYE